MAKRRRAINGQGSVYRRASDGLWCGALTLGSGRRKVVSSKTQAGALEKLEAERKKSSARLLASTDRATVGEYLAEWLTSKALSLKPATIRRYRELLLLHAVPQIGRVKLRALETRHLNALYSHCVASGLSKQTVRHIHAALHAALSKSPHGREAMAMAERPKPEKKEMDALAPEEARRLLDAASGDRLEAIYTLALCTGMREGELLALRWSDCHLDGDAPSVTVRRSLSWATGKPVFSDTKTGRVRMVQLPLMAVEELRRHRQRQLEERLASPWWGDESLVFTTAAGTPIMPTNLLRRSFHPLLVKAGLRRIRFHDLRHSSASTLLALGVPVNVVAQMLGHARTSTTVDTYGHVMPNQQREAAQRMQVALTG